MAWDDDKNCILPCILQSILVIALADPISSYLYTAKHLFIWQICIFIESILQWTKDKIQADLRAVLKAPVIVNPLKFRDIILDMLKN